MSPVSSIGVVYVATGESYVAEAAASLTLLRRSNPSVSAAIITDLSAPPGQWEAVLPLAAPTHSLRDKLQMRRSPWESTLFLDTDTYVATDLGDLFHLLASFDVVGHQLFEGHNYQLEGVPHAFPEFNTGVIGFRNTPAVQSLFDEWSNWYDRYSAETRCDQRSFRQALYRSGLRHSVLPPEYNFRPLATNFAIMPLQIVHGRPLAGLPALKEKIDVNFVHRAYVPRLGCVVSDHMTPRQAIRLWFAATLEVLCSSGRAFRHAVGRAIRNRNKPSGH